MKKSLLFLFVLSLLMLNCSKKSDSLTEPIIDPIWGDRYVVDNIYDYHNRLIASYTYDSNICLTQIIYNDPVNNRSSSYQFTYENERAKSIQFLDNNFPQFNHQILIFYNQEGRIIRDETWQNGNRLGYFNYEYNEKKRISNMRRDNGENNYFLSYDEEANIKQAKIVLKDPFNGAVSNDFRNFKYDDHQKPDFGLRYIFQIEPLPYFGTEARIEKNISAHNMTEYLGSGTKWIYTYNDHNQPATIETKWNNINTAEPMLLRLEYKKVP